MLPLLLPLQKCVIWL